MLLWAPRGQRAPSCADGLCTPPSLCRYALRRRDRATCPAHHHHHHHRRRRRCRRQANLLAGIPRLALLGERRRRRRLAFVGVQCCFWPADSVAAAGSVVAKTASQQGDNDDELGDERRIRKRSQSSDKLAKRPSDQWRADKL